MTNSSDQKSLTVGLTSLSQASSTPSESRNESSVSASPFRIISRLSTDETLTCSPGTCLKMEMASSAAVEGALVAPARRRAGPAPSDRD